MIKFNFYLGASAAVWLLTVLVIAAELVKPFKEFLKSVFTHHWLGKAIIITFAFLAIGFLLREKNSVAKYSDKDIAWYSVLVNLVLIFLFFVVEFFT